VPAGIFVVVVVTAGFNRHYDFLQYMLCRSIDRMASVIPCCER
jgi:hypothetical protein